MSNKTNVPVGQNCSQLHSFIPHLIVVVVVSKLEERRGKMKFLTLFVVKLHQIFKVQELIRRRVTIEWNDINQIKVQLIK